MTDEVRLHLVLFDEQPVAGVVEPPVDVPRIVARDVLAMSRELDREPRQWRLMGTRQRTQHQAARLDLPLGDLGQQIGIQVAGEGRLHGRCVRRRNQGTQAAGRS